MYGCMDHFGSSSTSAVILAENNIVSGEDKRKHDAAVLALVVRL